MEQIANYSNSQCNLARLEKEVARSHEFFNRVLETIVSAVLVADSSGNITSANQRAVSLFGENKPIIGESILDLLPFDELLMHAAPLEHIDGTLQGERDIIVKGWDDPISVLYSISHVVDPSGEQEGLVCVFTDITERKHLQQQLIQSQKMEAVGQLSAGIAHEINTPIQYIRDNTMFFKNEFENIKNCIYKKINNNLNSASDSNEEGDLDYAMQEIPQAIEETLEGIEAVADIVRSLKEFSHPGAEEKVFLDINQALHSTAIVSKNEWKYVAEISWDLDPLIGEIKCFPGELNQVFLNIIINAAHAIETNKKLHNIEERGLIKIKTSKDEDNLVITISDNGTGIEDHIKGKVFEPFFTTKEVGKGTGQGLSLAYSTVVQKHKGKIWFDSKFGSGSTFYISLPIAK